MYIKQIEIDNFKSFANNVTVPLFPGFTVISGPNGSGKSNIIDSVLFALGLSTNRSLRTEAGAADLITNHNKRGEASVKVIFGDEKNFEDVFSIKRHIKKGKNGVQSNYFYNDKPTTLTQIHLELEKFNITPNSYNVMMQGDVTEITKCSAVERRKIIDEIAGTADFERKIALAKEQIQSVEDRVNETNILLSAISEQIEKLKEEREVALKYKKLKEEKTVLENQIQGAKYFDIKRSLELVHQNILDNVKAKKDAAQRLKEIESKIDDVKLKYDEINAKVKAQGEEKQLEVKKTVEEKRGIVDRKNLAAAQAEKNTLENLKSIDSFKNGIESLQNAIKKDEANIEEKNKILEDLNKQLEAKKQELTDILTEMTGLNKSADEHIKNRNKLKKELDELNENENTLIKETLPKENEFNNNKEKSKKIKEDLDKLINSTKIFEDEKDKLNIQIETIQKELEDCKILRTKQSQELDKTKNEKEDNYFKIQQLQKRIAILEINKKAYKSSGNLSGVETVISANIQGVHKTISDLIDVEDKYVEAISVALGKRASSIVVDDPDVAYRAIQVLRSQGRDKASFIPMSIINKAPTRLALPKEKGVIDYAINLVDFDDEYIDAIYFSLGETLVVEDEVAAKKLARKYRVVTLEGDITEKSGLITGGAKRTNRSLFDKNQEKELEKNKKLLIELEENVKKFNTKEKELERHLEDIRQRYINSTSALNSAKLELKNLISNNETAAETIKNGEDELKALKEKNAKLEKELNAIESRHIKLQEKMQEKQQELSEVEKLIDEGELNKLKEKTDGVENDIKAIEKNIMLEENEVEKSQNQIKFQQNQITMRKNDIKRLTDDNIKLEEEKKQFIAEAKEVEKEIVELEKEIVELGKNLTELQTKRDEIQEELLNAKTNKNKYTDDIERLKEQEESFKARRRELEPILEAIIKEFEEQNINVNSLVPSEISLDEINSKISKLNKKMEDLEPVNMMALTQYDEVNEKQQGYREKVDTLESEKNEITLRMDGYQNLKKDTFLNAYHSINTNFKEIFAKISEGQGTLVLENENDPFMGGLTFEANIRDKKNQKLAGMSGGEKSLTALAFVFAIQKYLPSPFYAFDEVDMHLDGPNVERLGDIITKQSKEAQFIVVSLRKPMIDRSDRMVGVTQKNQGVTKVTGEKVNAE